MCWVFQKELSEEEKTGRQVENRKPKGLLVSSLGGTWHVLTWASLLLPGPPAEQEWEPEEDNLKKDASA